MIDSEEDLFVRELREVYGIERKLEALQSKLATEATDEALEEFYAGHSEATSDQLERLEGVFETIRVEPDAEESPRLEGLLDRREALRADATDPNVGDVIDAETGRAIERLEITAFETLLDLATRLDLDSSVQEAIRESKREAENGVERLQGLAVA